MERTFHSKECGVTVLAAGNVRLARESDPLSSEERLRAALIAVRALRLEMPQWVKDQIRASQDRWTRGAAKKDEVLALQAAIYALVPETERRDNDHRLKAWFLSSLDSSEDFRALHDLRRLHPHLLSDEDFLNATEDVAWTIDMEFRETLASATSAGELERAYEELSGVAGWFGLDAFAILDMDAYEERLAELGRIEDWQGEEAEERWRDERFARHAENEAIDALFLTLDY